MWTIRQEQTEALRQHHLKKFEDEMVAHLKDFAPQPCKVAGEAAVREVISLGVKNAGKYGFTNRGPLRFYIELMFMFGSYFDSDPQHPWAAAVLSDSETIGQNARAERLFKSLNSYLTRGPGVDNKQYFQALHRLSVVDVQEIVESKQPLEQGALESLHTIYPEACRFMGDQATEAIVRQGFEKARKFGFVTPQGMLLMVAFGLFMGHEFPCDPLCAWIATRLDGKRFHDPEKRTEELYAKAKLFLKHTLSGRVQT